MGKLYLEMDDTENKVPKPVLTERDDLFLVQLAEEYGNSFKKGTALYEKQQRWRKQHGKNIYD